MFTCRRCGSGYSASHIGVENCPRCLLRDRVQVPLSFKIFRLPDARGATMPPPSPPRRQAGSGAASHIHLSG
jgi:hypothetical protein